MEAMIPHVLFSKKDIVYHIGLESASLSLVASLFSFLTLLS